MLDRFEVVLAIAEALREEFGVGIDAHPGGERIEAGSVNRASGRLPGRSSPLSPRKGTTRRPS